MHGRDGALSGGTAIHLRQARPRQPGVRYPRLRVTRSEASRAGCGSPPACRPLRARTTDPSTANAARLDSRTFARSPVRLTRVWAGQSTCGTTLPYAVRAPEVINARSSGLGVAAAAKWSP